jgi:anaerobic selenocysteine-containing dehydrogenase
VHQLQLTYFGMPRRQSLAGGIWNPDLEERLSIPVMSSIASWQKQALPKCLVHKAIESDEPVTFRGTGAIEALAADQFSEYTYPIPEEEGGCEIHMIWTDTPCRITCWNGGNETALALQNPKIETIVAQHPWLENDCLYADIILPANTSMEVDDIVTNIRQGIPQPNIMIQDRAIEPIGESKSDFEIVVEVAKKVGLEEQITEGLSVREMQERIWHHMGGEKLVKWEELEEKKYWMYSTAEDWKSDPPGFRQFYEDPENHRLSTKSGKLEFYSEALAIRFPDDRERPPIPKWIERSATHDERLSSSRARVYPLLLMSNHGRWRVHSQCDDITWTREVGTCKVTGHDGYKYEPLWLHPSEAEKRGIEHGDIVKVINQRGVVLAGAYVTERLRPGVAYIDHGARADAIKIGEIDRGGAINTISPDGIISENCVGQATSGYLVQVEKVTGAEMERWRREYPDAFERSYDPGGGLRFDAWILKEGRKQ